MYIFHYDPWSRVYTGSDPCEFDQLEPGRILVPGAATSTPPPPAREGFDRVFNIARDEWEYIAMDARRE